MDDCHSLEATLTRIEDRLESLERKIDTISASPRKAVEWIGQLSEQVRSLDLFREEVRATLEPLYHKLESLDEVLLILRHATSDVSRRVEYLEGHGQKRMVG
jgi:chromosome segregation ATPase